jgi:hypothetical protein
MAILHQCTENIFWLNCSPFRREQLTLKIDELNEESEHWRRLGKEADDKLDGLRRSLEESRDEVRRFETLQAVPLFTHLTAP